MAERHDLLPYERPKDVMCLLGLRKRSVWHIGVLRR